MISYAARRTSSAAAISRGALQPGQSRNGTHVDGNLVEGAELRAGSYLTLGRTTLVAYAAVGARNASAIEMLRGHDAADVLAGGHTHVQMLRQHDGRLIINAGSVGMPFAAFVGGGPPTVLPHAEYATLDASDGAISVALHRLPLDRAELRESVAAASDHPMRDMLIAAYSG